MNKKPFICVIVFLLFCMSLSGLGSHGCQKLDNTLRPQNLSLFLPDITIIVPDDYPTIQQAVDHANPGDVVFVRNGTYYENIDITTSRISVKGEHKETTVIDAQQEGSAITMNADWITIRGFTITNSGSYAAGIDIHSDFNTISDNTVSLNINHGIYLSGGSHNNFIIDNVISDNFFGLDFQHSSHNIIIGNTITSNNNAGVKISNSSNNNYLVGNALSGNGWGIGLHTSHFNIIRYNNFTQNKRYDASFIISLSGDLLSNKWNENYWDTPRMVPKPIFGLLKINTVSIPWIYVDWHPTQEPPVVDINPLALINTSMGIMTVELFSEKMPITAGNFIRLANDGFFTDLVFHRVIDDFVIQGGGYYANGTQKKSPYGPITLETHPDVLHVDGAISMARTNDPNSATNQFFICDGPQHRLDGNYAAFGVIITGFQVLRDIASVETTRKYFLKDWPVDDVIINYITIIDP